MRLSLPAWRSPLPTGCRHSPDPDTWAVARTCAQSLHQAIGAQGPVTGARANLAALMLSGAPLWRPFPLDLREAEGGSRGGERGNFLKSLHE